MCIGRTCPVIVRAQRGNCDITSIRALSRFRGYASCVVGGSYIRWPLLDVCRALVRGYLTFMVVHEAVHLDTVPVSTMRLFERIGGASFRRYRVVSHLLLTNLSYRDVYELYRMVGMVEHEPRLVSSVRSTLTRYCKARYHFILPLDYPSLCLRGLVFRGTRVAISASLWSAILQFPPS